MTRFLAALALLAMLTPSYAATPMHSAGQGHTLALHADGTVRAWGTDVYGELGIGTVNYRYQPAAVAGIPPVRTIATGGGQALVIGIDGSVWGWGLFADWNEPRRITGLANVVAVAGGTNHNLAVVEGGQVWSWGSNFRGELGDGLVGDRSTPQPIALTAAVAVSAGEQHSLVLLADGTVWAFGANDYGQVGDGTNTMRRTPVQVTGLTGIVAISAGKFYNIALRSDGSVWTWGRNDEGALGDGTTTHRNLPIQVAGITAVKIAAGYSSGNHAVLADGTVWRWGAHAPAQLVGYSQIANVDSGNGWSMALRTDGTVWTEGGNFYGQSGRVGPHPIGVGQVPGLAGITAVAAGYHFAMALQNDGTVLTWGGNSFGELGMGRLLNKATPVQVTGLPSATQVSARGLSLALRPDGTVVYWGTSFMQTGAPLSTPTPLDGLADVTRISAGSTHGAAIKADGTLWSFGSGSYGELGRDQPDSANSFPAQVPGLSGVVRAAASHHFTVAVKGDGTVWAFGVNPDGMLGVPATATCYPGDVVNQRPCTPSPAQVQGIDGVVEVALGMRHILALRADGTVWSWGDNYNGSLGQGTEGGTRSTPAPIPDLSGVVAIAAGGEGISAALKSDGTVWTWGDNLRGQLGTSAVRFRSTPAQVAGLSDVAAISVGYEFMVAMRSDGVTWSWGKNESGQLGDGTYVDRSRPAVVLRESGAGTLDGNDWYLDLDPAAPNASIPFAATPGMLAVAQRSGSDTTVALDAVAKFKGIDFGRSVNLYVLAQVPPAFFDQVKLAPGAKSAAELRAKSGDSLVLAQLTPQGWTNAQGQLIAYSQNVGNAAGAAASILGGVNTTTIPGARFCIGYGETAEAMLNSIVLRDVLEVAGATGAASGVPCVLAGVYLGGPAASRLGTPVTFTASVVGLSPTGSVQFFDGAASLSGGVALTSANEAVARASVMTSSLAAGIHGIAASYSGDAQNASVAAANSTPLRHEVSAPAGGTRVDLTGPVSSQLGESVALTATVTGNNPTGTVQFRDGAANLGGPVPLVGAVAVLSVSDLAAGPHSITAAYSGDGNNAGNTSNALAHTVYASIATKVALTSSANPSAQGISITLTATVSGTSPTGSVVFRDGAAIVATVPLVSGATSTTLSGLGAGLHVMVADYLGDSSNPAASSPALFQQVTAAGATIGAFVARVDAAVSTPVTSNAALVTGVGPGQPVSVTGGEYSIGCTATFTSASGTVTEGQRVCVRHTSSVSFATIARTTLVVGTATADFTTTTMSAAFRAGITALVSHYYQAALRRPADPGGQAYWEAEGLRLRALDADIGEAFYAMAMAFFGSAEYAAFNRDNNGYVTDLYATFFDRAPDPGGLAHWAGQIASGLPREVLLAQFMFSQEFAGFMSALFGNRAARAEIDMVVDFYRGLLTRLPDSGGFAFWVQRFRAAQCAGAAQVVAEVEAISSAFAGSGEYAARNRSNTQYVGDLYNAFLRRGGDLGGVQFWIGQLDTSARTREDLRRAFVASPEFTARVNSVVAQGCLP